MDVITFKDALIVFKWLNERIDDTDKLFLYYDEIEDKILAGYSNTKFAKENVHIVIPRNNLANMTEGIFNLYVSKLKEKIKLNRMKEDF